MKQSFYPTVRQRLPILMAMLLAFLSTPLLAQPPANDDCPGATPLVVSSGFCSSAVVATNLGATDSSPSAGPPTGCPSIFFGGDIWFSALVPASGTIQLQVSAGGATPPQPIVAAYLGVCGSLVQFNCNSVNASAPFTVSGLTPGSTIFFRLWDAFNDDIGTFTVCAVAPLTYNILNDECHGAFPVNVYNDAASCVPTPVSTFGATLSKPFPNCINTRLVTNDDDVWFKFTAASDAVVLQFSNIVGATTIGSQIMDMCPTEDYGNTQIIGCDPGSTGANPDYSICYDGLKVGQTYLLRVWTADIKVIGATFDMCILETEKPKNDNVCDAEFLPLNVLTPWSNFCASIEPAPKKVFACAAEVTRTGVSSSTVPLARRWPMTRLR